MTTEEILILAGVVVLVLVLLGVAVWLFSSRRGKRQKRLRGQYGREYDAMVDSKGRRAGEEDLAHREEERQGFELRDPGEPVRADLRQRMADLQFRFVEEPQEVLLEVQRVVVDGLRARGYPVAEDRERALRLLSVDHPDETPPLRALLGGDYGRDVSNMQRLFLDARSALVAVLDVSYTQRDLSAAGGRAGGPREAEPRREPAPDPEQGREPARDPEQGREPARDPEQGRAAQRPRQEARSPGGQSRPGAYDVEAPEGNESRT